LRQESLRRRQDVIPAKAGIQRLQRHIAVKPWIPAFAGMTFWWDASALGRGLQALRVAAASR